MPKDVQTAVQLHSLVSHTRKVMLKILQARSQQWTVNFQMFKLDFKKAEEPEIKLPTSAGSSKKQQSSRCFIDYAKVFDCMDHNTLW